MAKIIIGADIVPTESNKTYFQNSHMEEIVDSKIIDILEKADYRILNLEVPLIDKENPILKCGPHLRASKDSIHGICQLGIDFLNLANNHILDQGVEGLQSTIDILNDADISYAGVGKNLQEASKPFKVKIGEKIIGIYCCTEHEFSIVNGNTAGANPFDELEIGDQISELKNKCDFLICLYHGGKEHYRYPSPNLQKRCRKIVEKGANLVVCQHSHCIGCEEYYKDGIIVYGQGNFLFDHLDNEFWKTSLLIEVDTERIPMVTYYPLEKNGNGVSLSNKKEIIEKFIKRSLDIQDEGFIEKQYMLFCDKLIDSFAVFTGIPYTNVVYRILNRLSKYNLIKFDIKRKLHSSKKLMMLNYIECEAWREVLITLLKRK